MKKIPPYLLLDGWRGIAALWVVAFHSCGPFLGGPQGVSMVFEPLYAVSIKGKLGVMMFFVVSGYCIAGACYSVLRSEKTIFQYVRDRFRRIYPPYLAAMMLGVVVTGAAVIAQRYHLLPPSNHEASPQTPLSVFSNLMMIQVELGQPTLGHTFWTLCYEVVFYLILGLLLALAISIARKKSPAVGLIPISVGVGWLTILSVGWLIIAPLSCPFPLTLWYQFGLGALFFLAIASESVSGGGLAVINHPKVLFVVSFVLILIYAILREMPTANGEIHAGHDFSMNEPSTRVQAGFVLGFVVVLWALRPFDGLVARFRVLKPILAVGVMSYSLYLVHSIALPFIDAGGRRLGFDGPRYWVTFLMEIGFSILAGWVFYYLVERHFISSRQKMRIAEEIAVTRATGPIS